jgi:penicillin V acylase-like amidase (Ntn superfamily)
MRKKITNLGSVISILILVLFLLPEHSTACSTFKLQKGNSLIYGHNLNEGDIGVPGLIFINKRGIFKTGKTWSEIINKTPKNKSMHHWISRYGSVTFNNFGRDFPDGGMNEAGLYIWEMNEDADYPRNDSLPKLNQMNWMQFILDNYSTLEEAFQCASEIEIDGWGWHYFVGDNQGNTAAIAFVDGKVVVHKGTNMPIPALFNTPYDREMELTKYFKPYGGEYEIDINSPQIPRFVKTDFFIKAYDSKENIIDYGFYMLDKLKVNDEPEWSIVFDARKKDIYFKTRLNPEIKILSMKEIDFSNNVSVLTLNMDIKEGGNVLNQFHSYSNEEVRTFTEELIFPILPVEFFTVGGLTKNEYLDRISTHSDLAKLEEMQFFKGNWVNKTDKLAIVFKTEGERVFGTVSNAKDSYRIDNLSMIGNNLKFTFRTNGKMIIEIKATIKGKEMNMYTYGIEDNYGSNILIKE